MLGPALHQLLETIAMLAAMVHLPTGQCAVLLGLVIAFAAGTAVALSHLHRRLPRARSPEVRGASRHRDRMAR